METFLSLCILALTCTSVNTQLAKQGWLPASHMIEIDASELPSSDQFKGKMNMGFNVTADIRRMTMDTLINVTSVTVLSTSWKGNLETEQIKFLQDNASLIIDFAKTLDMTNHTMILEFTGSYQTSMGGFSKLKIGDSHIGVASLEPNHARKVFPCYDDPHFRVSTTIDIIVRRNMEVIMSMPSEKTTYDSDKSKFSFKNYPPIAVHQLGWIVMDETKFAARELATGNKDQANITTRVSYPYANYTQWCTDMVGELVSALEEFTDQHFPLPKLEQIVLPDLESDFYQSWGLISYSDEEFLVVPQNTSTRDKQKLALSLAEGVAEQYFGGLISAESWSNIWLMKGFREYLKYTINVKETSSWELTDQMIVEVIQPALRMNNTQQALTLKELNESAQIQAAYSDLNKYKGGAVVRMVHQIMGDKLFKEVIKYFLKVNKHKVIDPSALWEVMYRAARDEKVDLADKSVRELMENWWREPSYPILSVTRNKTHFTISQETGNWYIRLSYILQKSVGKVEEVWLLPKKNVSISAADNDWILVNINQTSFCRVNYSSELWAVISRQLQTDLTQIPPLTRAQLIDDAFGLWFRGYLLTDTLLDCLGYLGEEKDYYPWHTAINNYKHLISRFIGFHAHHLLKNYMLNLMKKVVTDVGMASKPSDSHSDRLRRSLVLENACTFGHSECQSNASSMLNSWINGTNFDPDLNMDLLCAGVANSSADVWQKVHSMYTESDLPSVRAHLLPALACSTDQSLLKRFITNITLTSEYNEKEKSVLLKNLASTPTGSYALYEWLLDSLYSKLNRTRNDTSGNPTEEPVTKSPTMQDPNNTSSSSEVTAGTSDMSSWGSGADEPIDVRQISNENTELILSYLRPSLTHLDNGTKLETYLKNNPDLSATLLVVMKRFINYAYQQDDWARSRNGEIQIWLEKAENPSSVAPSPTAVTDTPPTTPSSAASFSPTLSVCLVTLTLMLRHFL